MKKTIIIALLVTVGLIVLSLMARSRGNNPGIEYAPDMYDSKGYEAYTQLMDDSVEYNRFGGSMREPVKGTVAVGQADYAYPYDNTPEGYEKAGAELSMPFIKDANGEGERLYGIYCSMCHGETGQNDGSVFQKDNTMKPSWAGYTDPSIRDLSVGKIYHTITYGKNKMGSHAYALSPEQRWLVIKHVKKLSNPNLSTADSVPLPKIELFDEIILDQEEKDLLSKEFSNVNFETGSSVLTKDSYQALDNVFAFLEEHKDRRPLIVKGHTDNTGDEYQNRVLSKERAEAVKAYLVSKGIAETEIYAAGYGSNNPLVTNDTEANKNKNRRVEFGFGNKLEN